MSNFYGQYIGFGAGGAVAPFVYGGTNYGYCAGGFAPSGPTGYNQDWIQKTSFSSDANATNIGALTVPGWGGAGTGNNVHGYCCGGYLHPVGPINEICRWSFSGDGDAVEVGDLSLARSYPSATTDKETFGYIHGGQAPSVDDRIDRFSFASGTQDATDVGNLTAAKSWAAGASTATHGYAAGGYTATDVIERYAFASSSDGAAIGDLTTSVTGGHGSCGFTSTTHGYYVRGNASNPTDGDIQKYAFAASSDSTNVGDCSATFSYKTGASSTTHGYIMGAESTSVTDTIEKFSLSADGDSAAIADLALAAQEGQGGTEY